MVCNDFYIRNLKGLFFLLFSCLLFSVTGTLQQLAPEGRTPVVIPEVRLVSVLLLPVTFFFPTEWIFTTRGILVSLGLGVVTAGIAYPCFTYGIKYTSPVAASTLALTEPLMAAALGICFLHELMIISMALGIFSLIGSVVVLIFDYP
ncbi:EamA family transporter [uncultured Parasutterella sp.]|uniref:EamA family transporter n=1 Tax=Parasutterella excrementihominis TaxID=487175 RepID=UPI0026184ED4|nr:EamA family transporter [uncultured Parasutterella sp.]